MSSDPNLIVHQSLLSFGFLLPHKDSASSHLETVVESLPSGVFPPEGSGDWASFLGRKRPRDDRSLPGISQECARRWGMLSLEQGSGTCLSNGLGAIFGSQFCKEIADMLLDGRKLNHQRRGDLLVRSALRKQA